MTKETRRAIAYIAGRAIANVTSSYVYDSDAGETTYFSGTVAPYRVQVFDHEAGSHITGSGNFSSLNLFHHGQSSHINLNIAGRTFRGFDYGDGSHFYGNVSGRSAYLYDYGTGNHYSFSF